MLFGFGQDAFLRSALSAMHTMLCVCLSVLGWGTFPKKCPPWRSCAFIGVCVSVCAEVGAPPKKCSP